MFVVVAWNVGNIKISVALIRELLELRIERFLTMLAGLDLDGEDLRVQS